MPKLPGGPLLKTNPSSLKVGRWDLVGGKGDVPDCVPIEVGVEVALDGTEDHESILDSPHLVGRDPGPIPLLQEFSQFIFAGGGVEEVNIQRNSLVPVGVSDSRTERNDLPRRFDSPWPSGQAW